ncbi:type IX secretion system PorP/SprF family membrane protein [Tenacibaculum adriaticum]|uniref:Type IX secretion system PorP/SprF family membrane protein n=1 Tax=Tenacibaculum adriaticum TaxID=413713 RepID=A0A5S5DWR4_9FLAO|nr:type IX secretion system membrane protein PorP/SprF [Tenacibaculum adriaticum]TYQ00276.1 type IX secretion system PorP/SprF family membrane protein [Tenacibaculum adriaticum]
MKTRLYFFLIISSSLFTKGFSQETLPIYQDYLSDNVYLVHPAAAGIGECGKIRLTARSQWLGVDNAPQLQTASFHAKVSNDSKAAFGTILFNDKNGYHSQKGIQGTYAYHLEMDRGNGFNQLSFGLSLSAVQNEVDQSSFSTFDPEVQQIIESDFYFNADFGLGYHLGGFSSYFTVKNIFLTAKNNLRAEFDALNLRNYVLGVGYFFGDEKKFQIEPSLMFQYKEQTSEKIVDINFKIYKNLEKAQIWAALSYRTSFDGNSFEEAQYFSPILGVNYNKMMFSYTYTKQMGDIVLSKSGFHQISLGFNVLCRKARLSACPNINGGLF